MNFLNPLALAIAALVAVPLLIHLLHRDTRLRVSFPALRYLQASQRQHARSMRLRDLLLLVLRVALIVLIALVASRPLMGRGDAGDHRPTDVAIVIDNSASMSRLAGDDTMLEAELERARITIREAGSQDRFWVIPVVGDQAAVGVPAEDALAALDRIPLTDAWGSIGAAARTAALALPEATDREREVHVLSDLQESALGDRSIQVSPDLSWIIPTGVDPEPNGALTQLRMSTGTSAVQGIAPDVSANPVWFGERSEADSVTVRLESDRQTAALVQVGWGDAAVFRLSAESIGNHFGKLQIPPTGLRADDARYFALRVEPAPGVSHAGPGAGFVGSALASLRAAGRVGSGPANVFVVEGDAARLPAIQVVADASERRPALVLIPPADPLLLARFNQWLSAQGIPERLSSDPGQGRLRLEGPGTLNLANVEVRKRYLMVGDADSDRAAREVLISTADGLPWLVRGGDRRVAYVLVASPLEADATSLPLSPQMIPFVENLVLRWSQGTAWPGQAVDAGTTLVLPATADSLAEPDGHVRRVDGGLPFRPMKAGIYRIFHRFPASTDASLVAVNVPLAESDVTPASATRIESVFAAGRILRAGRDPDSWRGAIYQSRRGTDISSWLLVLLIAVAVAEAWIAAPGADSDRARRHAVESE